MMNRYFNVTSLTDKQKGQALLCGTGLDGWKKASEGFFQVFAGFGLLSGIKEATGLKERSHQYLLTFLLLILPP